MALGDTDRPGAVGDFVRPIDSNVTDPNADNEFDMYPGSNDFCQPGDLVGDGSGTDSACTSSAKTGR